LPIKEKSGTMPARSGRYCVCCYSSPCGGSW